MPAGTWPLLSGHRPMASMCYEGPAYYFRPWKHSLSPLMPWTLRSIEGPRCLFSLEHLGHMSKTPAVTLPGLCSLCLIPPFIGLLS